MKKKGWFLAFALITAIASWPIYAQAPSPADLVDNQAFIKLDRFSAPGEAFGMHFTSSVKVNGVIWAYYIKWEGGTDQRGGVGLATSIDGVNYVDQGFVLRAGELGAWDSKFATFPGVWYENGTFYLVYEGAGTTTGNPGDIGLATSSDGINFARQGRILTHNSSGWERTNIGTPSLYRENGIWYLFYHGFDGITCQIGVATGTSLTQLTKSGLNPIVRSLANTWQSGTAGRRSVIKSGSRYYMVFEGSEAQPYDRAKWSSGIATSTNLIQWSLYAGNALLPQTQGGFGNDGPEFLQHDGQTYLYYRASPGTRRALIANEIYGGFGTAWFPQSPGIGHLIGRLEGDGGWAVSVLDTPNQFMQFGPYVQLPESDHIATWKLLIDNNSADNLPIVRLEVYDYTDNTVLTSRTITRKRWNQPNRYEYFSVPFNLPASRAGHSIEFRVFYIGHAYVKQALVGLD